MSTNTERIGELEREVARCRAVGSERYETVRGRFRALIEQLKGCQVVRVCDERHRAMSDAIGDLGETTAQLRAALEDHSRRISAQLRNFLISALFLSLAAIGTLVFFLLTSSSLHGARSAIGS